MLPLSKSNAVSACACVCATVVLTAPELATSKGTRMAAPSFAYRARFIGGSLLYTGEGQARTHPCPVRSNARLSPCYSQYRYGRPPAATRREDGVGGQQHSPLACQLLKDGDDTRDHGV